MKEAGRCLSRSLSRVNCTFSQVFVDLFRTMFDLGHAHSMAILCNRMASDPAQGFRDRAQAAREMMRAPSLENNRPPRDVVWAAEQMRRPLPS